MTSKRRKVFEDAQTRFRLLWVLIAFGAVFALVVATLTACGAGFGADTGRCRVTAENPHESRGRPGEIVGKGRITCEVPAENVYLYVKIQHEVQEEWVDLVPGDDPAVGAVVVGKQQTRQAVMPCRIGTFRTAARGKGTLGGQPSESAAWTVVPPKPSMTSMEVRFVDADPDAGDAAVNIAGSNHEILIDVVYVHRTEPDREPFDPDMTYVDSAVIAVLNGGYHEWVAYNKEDEWVERGWALRDYFYPYGSTGYNIVLPPDRKNIVRRERREFPAWPKPGEPISAS